VLGKEAARPRDVPPEVLAVIAQARDPRHQQRRTVTRRLLVTELRNLERLLKVTPQASADRPALIRRIAETQVELAAAANEANDLSAERRHRRGAIQHYEQLAKSYPGSARSDEVLYYLALEHERLGDLANARTAYLKLVDKARQSPLVPQAYFAFGELFFDEARKDPAKLPLTRQFYQQVVKWPPPGNAAYGLAWYRLGHVYWREQNGPEALDSFMKALQHAHRFATRPAAKTMRQATIEDLVHVYADVGHPSRACAFLHRVVAEPAAPEATLRALTTLGETYLRRGRRAEALVLYRTLQRYHGGAERCRDQAVLRMLVGK
jgi:tetratricopeptide (TPR) repeat protein